MSDLGNLKCRVCGSGCTRAVGVVEYYRDFPSEIYDCDDCGSRFTNHDARIYNYLHSSANSSYGTYREIAEKCAGYFGRKDLAGLRESLRAGAKFKFVIESLKDVPLSSRLLEVGCSSGHLTSYFILAGHDIVGTDVSAEAIRRARLAFGPHFEIADSAEVERRAPFDAIYHVGTIGCVADPIGLTRKLLCLLRPDGQLLFNSPNADSCSLTGQMWVDEAPPPDVVTLFRPGFWKCQFEGVAEVSETVQTLPPTQSFAIGLQKNLGRGWQRPTPLPIEEGLNDFKGARVTSRGASGFIKRVVISAARRTRAVRFARERAAPFGLMVKMIKRQACR